MSAAVPVYHAVAITGAVVARPAAVHHYSTLEHVKWPHIDCTTVLYRYMPQNAARVSPPARVRTTRSRSACILVYYNMYINQLEGQAGCEATRGAVGMDARQQSY